MIIPGDPGYIFLLSIIGKYCKIRYNLHGSGKSKILGGNMLFKKKDEVILCGELEEKIKNDLISVLKRNGLDILKIHLDLESGNLNLRLNISKN
ncbi:MAG: hypothetical protein K0R31_1663 [Clostridiales bacterium]|nr:hypothetical protein [Clostridiales bacterium]